MNTLIDPTSRLAGALMEAILNSLWQGILLTALVAGALLAFRRINAATRHVIWWATLVTVITLPLANSAGPGHRTEPTRTTGIPATALSPAQPDAITPTSTLSGPPKIATPPVEALPVADAPVVASSPPIRPVVHRTSEVGSDATAASARFSVSLKGGPWASVFVWFWLAGSSFMLLRVLRGYWHLRQLKADSLPLPDQDRLHKWVTALGIRRAVQMRTSRRIATPMAVGLRQPVVLIPETLVGRLSGDEFEQVGLHELSHLRRWDDWTNFAQQIITALFFFHPAVLWIGRQIGLQREIACDDSVVGTTGQAKPYALCLTKLVELTGLAHRSGWAPGAWNTESQLARRITLLLDRQRNSGTRTSKPACFSAIGILAVGLALSLRTAPLIAVEQALPEANKNQSVKAKPAALASTNVNAGTLAVGGAKNLTPEQKRAATELQQRMEVDKRQAEAQAHKQAELQQRTLISLLEIARNDADANVRHQAVLSIINLSLQSSIEPLSQIALKDPNAEVRSLAIYGIANFGNGTSMGALLKLYDDMDQDRFKLLIIQQLRERRKQDTGQTSFPPGVPQIPRWIEFVPPKAIPKLTQIAKEGSTKELRSAAIGKLSETEGEIGTEALISVYDSCKEGDIRQQIVQLLGSRNGSKLAADKLLVIAKSDPDPNARKTAVKLLGDIASGRAQPTMFVRPPSAAP